MLKFQNILLIGIIYRISIYFLLILIPFQHNNFGFLTPLTFQEFADLNFYMNFGEKKFEFSNFFFNYYSVLTLNFSNIDNRFPGPLFPFILFISQYDKNT